MTGVGAAAYRFSFFPSDAGVGHVVGQAEQSSDFLRELGVSAVAEVAGQRQGRGEVVAERCGCFPGTAFVVDFFFEEVAQKVDGGKVAFGVPHEVAAQFMVGGGRVGADGEALSGAQVVVAETAANRVVQIVDAGVSAEAVGTAEFAAVVFVVGGQFIVFADFVGSAGADRAGFIVGVEDGGGKRGPCVQKALVAILVEFTGEDQVLELFDGQQIAVVGEFPGFRVVAAVPHDIDRFVRGEPEVAPYPAVVAGGAGNQGRGIAFVDSRQSDFKQPFVAVVGAPARQDIAFAVSGFATDVGGMDRGPAEG